MFDTATAAMLICEGDIDPLCLNAEPELQRVTVEAQFVGLVGDLNPVQLGLGQHMACQDRTGRRSRTPRTGRG